MEARKRPILAYQELSAEAIGWTMRGEGAGSRRRVFFGGIATK
jgi:hypothetical protein